MMLWPFPRSWFEPIAWRSTPAIKLRPKPRVCIRQTGWVRHNGGSFPFAPETFVEVIYACGLRQTGEHAKAARTILDDWWRQKAGDPRYNVMFYRIVSPPVFPEVMP
jgi:hypothetical protein